MKFMKLGSKPDAFQAEGNCIRYVASDLATDIVIHVGEAEFYLHKFPLLSKSNYLQKLVSKANEEGKEEVHILDFPGGPKAFEICAKFCYGMTVTLNAYNVVAARCAAEYLEMNEDVDRGNLIFKIEVFLNSSILRSWKDSIIVLQTTKSLLPLSEDLKVVGRCIDSIASKTSVDPASVHWSYTYNRKMTSSDQIVESTPRFPTKILAIPKDWWIEDICELDIDLYKRVMFAIKAKGRMSSDIIGAALQAFAHRWLPDTVDALVSDDNILRNQSLVEMVIWLLPSNKGICCSCNFLLKLLKIAILVGAGDKATNELIKKISMQLDEASVKDLLIPSKSDDNTVYDFGLVQALVSQFVTQQSQNLDYVDKSGKGTDVLGRGSWLKVGKLVDGYLFEVSGDPNLPLASFVDFSQSIPEFARPIHDGLYRAIDIYLKEHPNIIKADRKKICSLMDVKKLTMEASMHAAQNDRIPLRVVVQVLFFEQVKAAVTTTALNHNTSLTTSYDSSLSTTTNTEDWEKTTSTEDYKSVTKEMENIKVSEEHVPKSGKPKNKKISKSKVGNAVLLPSRSRRIFDKLWVGVTGHGENRNSETSGSSMSPTSIHPGENKSSSSSSRHRRHSVS